MAFRIIENFPRDLLVADCYKVRFLALKLKNSKVRTANLFNWSDWFRAEIFGWRFAKPFNSFKKLLEINEPALRRGSWVKLNAKLPTLIDLFLLDSQRKSFLFSAGHVRKIRIPSCIEFEIRTNACRGYCLSYSMPSTKEALSINPKQILTSVSQCCTIQETEDVSEAHSECGIHGEKNLFICATRCCCRSTARAIRPLYRLASRWFKFLNLILISGTCSGPWCSIRAVVVFLWCETCRFTCFFFNFCKFTK